MRTAVIPAASGAGSAVPAPSGSGPSTQRRPGLRPGGGGRGVPRRRGARAGGVAGVVLHRGLPGAGAARRHGRPLTGRARMALDRAGGLDFLVSDASKTIGERRFRESIPRTQWRTKRPDKPDTVRRGGVASHLAICENHRRVTTVAHGCEARLSPRVVTSAGSQRRVPLRALPSAVTGAAARLPKGAGTSPAWRSSNSVTSLRSRASTSRCWLAAMSSQDVS